MNNGYFNIKRDLAIENDGGFFCETCIISKPASERSPDKRYCCFCFDLLLNEARLGNSRPKWMPKVTQVPPTDALRAKIGHQKVVKVKGGAWY